MNGYSSIGQNIYMYSSKQLVNEKLIGLLIEGDASNMNNSDGTFIDLSIIGSPLVSTTGHIVGIKMPVGMDHLIHVGSADTVKAGFDNEVNITSIVNHTNSELKFLQMIMIIYILEVMLILALLILI